MCFSLKLFFVYAFIDIFLVNLFCNNVNVGIVLYFGCLIKWPQNHCWSLFVVIVRFAHPAAAKMLLKSQDDQWDQCFLSLNPVPNDKSQLSKNNTVMLTTHSVAQCSAAAKDDGWFWQFFDSAFGQVRNDLVIVIVVVVVLQGILVVSFSQHVSFKDKT